MPPIIRPISHSLRSGCAAFTLSHTRREYLMYGMRGFSGGFGGFGSPAPWGSNKYGLLYRKQKFYKLRQFLVFVAFCINVKCILNTVTNSDTDYTYNTSTFPDFLRLESRM